MARTDLTGDFGITHATKHSIHDVADLGYKDIALLKVPNDMFCQSRSNEGRRNQVCPDTARALLGVVQDCTALITKCL